MVEPTACAVHGALAARVVEGDLVVVLGAGTLGLLIVAALRRFAPPCTVLVVAKHPVQRELALELGADTVVAPGELPRAVRRATGTMALGDGDIAASPAAPTWSSTASAATPASPRPSPSCAPGAHHHGRHARPHPGRPHRALAPGDHAGRGLRLRHRVAGRAAHRRTFDLAFELVDAADLGRLVSATYPLARYEDAIGHAANAGSRGAVRIAFDLRNEKDRNRA